jgi:hypothetical protein
MLEEEKDFRAANYTVNFKTTALGLSPRVELQVAARGRNDPL